MCEAAAPIDLRLTRRRLLVAAPLGLVAGAVVARAAPVLAAPGLTINPRSSWGGDLAPTGPIPDEPEVRVLLVHHSVNANTYAASAVPGLLRSIYSFHTGEKAWPDVAYNFFVDRFGGVWEGRTGSLAGAKAGDATGGNQGSSQLCCFLGEHSTAAPTAEAQASMGALLGWLAERHGIELADGARARFTSRGSNRFPAGAAIDVPTIAGHRDVTQTACPGNAAYALVTDGTFRRLAGGGGAVAAPPTTAATTTTAPTTTAAPTTTTTMPSTTTSSSTTTTAPTTTTTAPALAAARSGSSSTPSLVAGGLVATVVGAAIAVRARVTRRT